jgi:hypothetical protein
MKSEILKWQSEKDWDTGVLIYQKYGTDSGLKLVFGLGQNSYSSQKLETALEDLLESVKEKDPTPKPVLDIIRKRSQYHELLFTTTATSDRHKIAQAILALSNQLDRWYDHGELPKNQVENRMDEPEIPENAWELHQLINNNFAYMTKNKAREDKQGEVKRRERMNGKIEERLKSMNYEQSIS